MPSEFASRAAEFIGADAAVPLDAVVIVEYLDEHGRHRLTFQTDPDGVPFHQIGLCETVKARIAARLHERS